MLSSPKAYNSGAACYQDTDGTVDLVLLGSIDEQDALAFIGAAESPIGLVA